MRPMARVCDVDADPAALQLGGGVQSRAAAAERVEHDVAGIGRGGENALQQRDRLLRGVAEAFFGLGVKRTYVVPESHPTATGQALSSKK